jgi:hypothetical protein
MLLGESPACWAERSAAGERSPDGHATTRSRSARTCRCICRSPAPTSLAACRSDFEVEFAARASYLALGKEVGDCTADKLFRQVDRDVENIYWTVFSWVLDRNYQILKVYYDGEFVMKVHLLPLLAVSGNRGEVFLAVDAIETTPAFREDTHVGHPDLLEKKEYIFSRMVQEVEGLARAMGIDHVYAERFSNTEWVRRELERFPEVYLHMGISRRSANGRCLRTKRVCAAAGQERRQHLHGNQMKNTFLHSRRPSTGSRCLRS